MPPWRIAALHHRNPRISSAPKEFYVDVLGLEDRRPPARSISRATGFISGGAATVHLMGNAQNRARVIVVRGNREEIRGYRDASTNIAFCGERRRWRFAKRLHSRNVKFPREHRAAHRRHAVSSSTILTGCRGGIEFPEGPDPNASFRAKPLPERRPAGGLLWNDSRKFPTTPRPSHGFGAVNWSAFFQL